MQVFGVKIELRPSAAVPGLALVALSYALLPADDKQRLATALASGALWYEAELNHVSGHWISGRLSGAPMDRIRWGILPATLYENNDVAPRTHIGRAIGGPLGSASSMLTWWLVWRILRGKPGERFALIALAHNTFLTLGSWLPLPWVDGGVILKNIPKL